MSKVKLEREIFPHGLADFIETLAGISRQRPKYKSLEKTPAFKRNLASGILAANAAFLKANGISEGVLNALVEVALGLESLNDGKLADVMKYNPLANRTTPTNVMVFRADIAALHYAITKGAPPEMPAPTARDSTVLILRGLGNEIHKVLKTSDTSTEPGKAIDNLLRDFMAALSADGKATEKSQKAKRGKRTDEAESKGGLGARRIRINDDIAAMRFVVKRQQYCLDLLTLNQPERERRIKAIVMTIKNEIREQFAT